ncbi:LOW QUALITY PROTEIN: hypothetical protein EUGRSUZ_E02514 [Eucalyptus grandis]|uniref:Uncharacterized protein n=1 Tax=Eucalyptus grandis TaxID=71139 RepID=A0ACC3KWN0_EUCGR|nr:LOW QUALITY PROTEIN: hypothetical protein EUGRSUZ_E02514 [Eucalyptus grandis]
MQDLGIVILLILASTNLNLAYPKAGLEYGLFYRKSILDNMERFCSLEVCNRGVNSMVSGRGAPLQTTLCTIPNFLTRNILLPQGYSFPRVLAVPLPSEEGPKLNRVLTTAQESLSTAKTDMEDLIARLNQEIALRQFLTTKVCFFLLEKMSSLVSTHHLRSREMFAASPPFCISRFVPSRISASMQ